MLAGPPASDERQTLPEAATGLQQQGQPEGEQRRRPLITEETDYEDIFLFVFFLPELNFKQKNAIKIALKFCVNCFLLQLVLIIPRRSTISGSLHNTLDHQKQPLRRETEES